MTTGNLFAMVRAASLPWETYIQLMFILHELADLQDELASLRWERDYKRAQWRRAFYLLN